MKASFDTSIVTSTPALSVSFMQSKLDSWVDIAIYVTPVPFSNVSFPNESYLSESVHLSKGSNFESGKLGSVHDKMCVIHFVGNSIDRAKFRITVKTRFWDITSGNPEPSLQFPLTLLWNATLQLSKRNPDYVLKSPGQPIELIFSNSVETNFSLNIFWIFGQKYSQKYFESKIDWWPSSRWVGCNVFFPSTVPHHGKLSSNISTYHLDLSKTIQNSLCKSLKRNIMKGVYNNYQIYEFKSDSSVQPKCMRCFNSSFLDVLFDNQRVHYVVFDYDFTKPDTTCKGPYETKKSWIEASKLCRAAGGYLPIIRSRNELEEIMYLMKTKYLPPIDLIFIGFIIDFKVTFIVFRMKFDINSELNCT